MRASRSPITEQTVNQRWNPMLTIMRRARARSSQEDGAVLVEFAIILPVLVLIILGILYFGRYMDYTNQLTQLAEEGARWAAVNNNPGTPTTLQNYIKQQAQPELSGGSSDVGALQVYIYYPTGSSNTVGNSVRVCAKTTFNYPFLGVAGTTQTVVQTATMRIEQADSSAFTADTTVPSSCSKS
jgi:Flp pilus assembly protein TadG